MVAALSLLAPLAEASVLRFAGLCDASAAVALDAAHFIVADDESNTLAVYRRSGGSAVAGIDLGSFLKADKESDLEGAARMGERVYWIASHGRNAKGKLRPDRHRFFATELLPGRPPGLKPVGQPYTDLLTDLIAAPHLVHLDLAEAASRTPEADGGFNIEGLAEGPQGQLLIGLRNPLRAGRALLIPLLNPGPLADGQGPARFGEALQLDLGGRGIRSIDRVGAGYLITAGPPGDSGSFAVYRWSGRALDTPVALPLALDSLRPEGLLAWPDGELMLISDDGGVEVGGVACKDREKAQRSFRAVGLAGG